MTTGTILVQDAMAMRGILADDVAPSTAQLNLGLRLLNRMLASWGNETELIFGMSEESVTMTPGTATYTTAQFASGSGRPVGVDSITLTLSGVTYTVDLVDVQTYNSITFKNVNSIPTMCYYDAAYPTATFHFYPAPMSAFVADITCYEKLTGAITSSTDLVLPDGYEKAIVDNLCIYLNWGPPVTAQQRLDANESRNVIKRRNYSPLLMDSGFSSGYSVNNDFPYRGF